MSARTLVLGGGFGGIATAVELRRLLGDDHEIVLVDRKPQFAMGLRKLWELVGHGTIADGSRSARAARAARRRVPPDGDHGDRCLGTPRRRQRTVGWKATVSWSRSARCRGPTSCPGSRRTGTTCGTSPACRQRPRRSRGFDGGRIVVLVAGAPYPCPPAPYECVAPPRRAPRRPWFAGPDGARGCDAPADADAERRS